MDALPIHLPRLRGTSDGRKSFLIRERGSSPAQRMDEQNQLMLVWERIRKRGRQLWSPLHQLRQEQSVNVQGLSGSLGK
jgi:hypothetical protein